MEPIDYLRGVKRRWRIVVSVVALSLVVGGLSLGVGRLSGKGGRTAATTALQWDCRGRECIEGSLAASSQRAGVTGPLPAFIAMITVDDVANRVAKTVGFKGNPQDLMQRVRAVVDAKSGFIKITATFTDPERAKQIADTAAREFIAYLTDRERSMNAAEAASVQAQITRVKVEIATLDREIAKYRITRPATRGAPATSTTSSAADPLVRQRSAALDQLALFSNQLEIIRARVADGDGMRIVQAARITGKSGGGVALPASLAARLGIAGFLGLLAGIGLALLRDRFDRRIRTREAAEQHFGYPVVAEIPADRHRGRNGSSPGRTEPAPAVADAFRLLSAGIENANGARHGIRHRSRTILVTSAGPDDGKTSVVARLATSIAETGKVVTILGCDFRRPEVHAEFDVPNERGLRDALQSSNGSSALNGYLFHSSIPGVQIVPSGPPVDLPAPLLASQNMQRVMTEARQQSDVVLVDTSPVLTSDLTFLLPEIDTVLVVTAVGKTDPALAVRSGELLRQLGAPVLGLVMTGDTAVSLPADYYQKRFLHRLGAGVARTVLWAPRTVGRGLRRIVRRSPKEDQGFPPLPRRSADG